MYTLSQRKSKRKSYCTKISGNHSVNIEYKSDDEPVLIREREKYEYHISEVRYKIAKLKSDGDIDRDITIILNILQELMTITPMHLFDNVR